MARFAVLGDTGPAFGTNPRNAASPPGTNASHGRERLRRWLALLTHSRTKRSDATTHGSDDERRSGMTDASTLRQVVRVGLAAMGAVMMTLSAATAMPQELPPKPQYLGAEPDPSSVSGVRLNAIDPRGPAEKAGLQVGDVIVRFGGMTIENPEDLMVALKSTFPGRPTEVVYLRAGKELRTQVSLEPRR
jgi:hypothetical protein